jgi:protein-tyrosine phosphatase
MSAPSRILFVCLGNICRSPAAEAAARAKALARGLDLHLDSAGTGGWHVGEPPDARMQAAARRRGFDLSALRARQVAREDFFSFDLIFGMDQRNCADLLAMRPPGAAPVELFLARSRFGARDTPDPYYGDAAAFERALDLIEAGADDLVNYLAGARE